MNKFFTAERFLNLAIFIVLAVLTVMFNEGMYSAIAESGSLQAYFDTNCFAFHSLSLAAIFDFFMFFPAVWCFGCKSFGKDFDYAVSVIFAPFEIIDRVFNRYFK